MKLNVTKEQAALQRMTIGELRDRFAEVHGEPTRSFHKEFLIRRILWRMQALEEGDLTERARRRAAELANDADIRLRPPQRLRLVTDNTKPFMKRSLGLEFVNPKGEVWSEVKGRFISRADFLSEISPELLNLIKGAVNYPQPTSNDTTKPIRQMQFELKVVWTAICAELPDEVHADSLGPDSKAADEFRQHLLRLWQTPETWIKCQSDRSDGGHVERMSLSSRTRELDFHARSRPPEWSRVLKGVNAFYRVEKSVGGKSEVWLGMRWDLCRGEIKGVNLPAIKSQSDLTILMKRYGLSCTSGIIDRLRDGGVQRRVSVLARELCDHLIECVDHDTEGAVTEQAGEAVTGGGSHERIDMDTGEVLS